MTAFGLNDLEKIIHDRAVEGSTASYTAKLLAAGIELPARKMGEEALEAVIAAVTLNRDELKKEMADLIYHALVVMRAADLSLGEVMAELERRTSQSGLEEKASRPMAGASKQ